MWTWDHESMGASEHVISIKSLISQLCSTRWEYENMWACKYVNIRAKNDF